MSTPSSTPAVVRVTRHFPFPAERVFDAWLDPAIARRWLYSDAKGEIVRADIDARVGGRFIITDRREDGDIEHTGEYLEIDRPRRLAFTFGVLKFDPGYDRVTIEIVPDADGAGCELTLTQEMTNYAEWGEQTREGWTMLLGRLEGTLGDAPSSAAAINDQLGEYTAPGEVRFVRLLPGPIERVWDYITDGEKRSRWLASGPMELRVGGSANLFFRHANISPDETPPEQYRKYHDTGDTMQGVVTRCDPPRLLSFTWGGVSVQEDSEVTFELTPKGEDVELVLTHRRLGTDPDENAGVGAGWHTHVAILIAYLAGTQAPPFWLTHTQKKLEYANLLKRNAATTK